MWRSFPGAPRGDEFDIMTDEIVVVELCDSTQDRRVGYEIALDRGALTAFLSWLESRPSPRAVVCDALVSRRKSPHFGLY